MNFLDLVSKDVSPQAYGMLLYGVEKIGKTSIASHAKDPVFLMSPNERGLLALVDSGVLPKTPYARFKKGDAIVDTPPTWADALNFLDALERQDHKYKTLVIDAVTGMDHLCVKHVINTKHDGDDAKFYDYGRGWPSARTEWKGFITALDRLRINRGINVILLGHSRVKNFKNPMGADYDQFQLATLHDSLSEEITRWADMILFAHEITSVDDEGKPQGQVRQILTSRSAVSIAGNRIGLPRTIPMGSSHVEAWRNISGEIKKAREKGQAARQQPSDGKAA